jgi:hypothetical protein
MNTLSNQQKRKEEAAEKPDPIIIKVDFDDIVSFIKPRHTYIYVNPEPNQPNVEISFETIFGEQPYDAQEAADGIEFAWKQSE